MVEAPKFGPEDRQRWVYRFEYWPCVELSAQIDHQVPRSRLKYYALPLAQLFLRLGCIVAAISSHLHPPSSLALPLAAQCLLCPGLPRNGRRLSNGRQRDQI